MGTPLTSIQNKTSPFIKTTKMNENNTTAFPTYEHDFNSDNVPYLIQSSAGMTLLDYFAAKAIVPPTTYRPANLWQYVRWAFNYSYKCNHRPPEENAIKAYELAAAMLEERKKHLK